MIIRYLLVVGSLIASIQGARNCGPNPSKIYLKRGDKSSIEYWVPPPEPADDDLQPLQSRQNNVQVDEEEEETPVTSAAPSTTTGGLTTWRMDDDEFVNEPTDSPAIAESATFITTTDEPAAADTGLKVTDVDDVTTILPDDAAAATDGVNDQPDGAVASDQEFDVVTDPSSIADTFRSDVTELTMTEQPEEPDSLLSKVNAAVVETFEGSAENDGSGDLPVVIRLEPSQPEEINMDPIVAQLTETPEIEINNKAEMLDNLMKEEDLRPHQESKKDAAPTTTAESVTIENAELIHPTSQSPAEGIAGPSVTEEPVVFSTDSVQIEITKDQPAEKQELDLSVSSQLKDDVESDITHILMEIPALPQSDSQIKEEQDEESQFIQTEEPETVTILDFKNELGSAVDIHSEEIAEAVTAASDVLKLATEEPRVEADSVSVQPDAVVIQEEEAETATKAELEFKATDEGSGFDEILPVETLLLSSDEPNFKVDGSGDAPSADAKDIEGSGCDPVETAVKIPELDQLEGSGSLSVQLVVDEPEPRDQVIAVEEEEESPPEFRNDDILINRIRTIVNSLTNPRETSSILLRRTSDLFQSVFKRTKRSPSEEFDPSQLVRSPAFLRYLRSQPLPLRRALSPNFYGRFSRQMHPDMEFPTGEDEGDECDLHIKTDPGLHLLLTFHNLSAPYTVDCAGAYVEIEREGNGFEARWCGNPIGQRGVRSHVIFARSEVRVSVYSNKKTLLKNQIHSSEGENNSLDPQSPSAQRDESIPPTGFSADIEVIDLHDAGQYTSFQRSEAYSSVHRKIG